MWRHKFCFILLIPVQHVWTSYESSTLHKIWNFSIQDFFSKCDQIRKKLRICSHLLKKALIENFIFCAVQFTLYVQGHREQLTFFSYALHLLLLVVTVRMLKVSLASKWEYRETQKQLIENFWNQKLCLSLFLINFWLQSDFKEKLFYRMPYFGNFSKLHKIPKFHLISWFWKFPHQ